MVYVIEYLMDQRIVILVVEIVIMIRVEGFIILEYLINIFVNKFWLVLVELEEMV